MADTVQLLTEKDKSKTGIESFLGETLIITGIGAILYFWGILYYLQLTESLGLGISLFSISPYEVIVAPWANAIWVLIWAGALWVLWHQLHIHLVIVYYVLALIFIPVAFCFKVISGIKPISYATQAIACIGRMTRTLFRKIPSPPDQLLVDFANPTKDRSMFIATAQMLIVFSLIGIGLSMPAKAKARVNAHLKSSEKSHVEVLCTDDSIVKGEYVLSLGDAIVVDLEQDNRPMRVLIKQAQIKRIIKLLPEKPAKVPKVSPVSNESSIPSPAPSAQPPPVPPAP